MEAPALLRSRREKLNAKIHSVHLSGRFSWNRDLTLAARRYAREQTDDNFSELTKARKASAKALIEIQLGLGFEYPTDGGFGQLDMFSPYVGEVEGLRATGNIDKYPGTRNSYYHTPLVEGKIEAKAAVAPKSLFNAEFPAGCKRKAILPSPVAFALACENTFYPSREEVVRDFSEVLKRDVGALSRLGYGYIQLTDAFMSSRRFAPRVSEGLSNILVESLATIFEGFEGRSCYYFHSDDCSKFLPSILRSGVTDVGFDFNTLLESLSFVDSDKNVVIGVQNAARKLPAEILKEEPELIAWRAAGVAKSLSLSDSCELAVCPSQDYDGLQTYPQALARMRSLAQAVKIAGGAE